MILLTGASGFIGKHLLKALVKKYGSNNVIAFSSKPTEDAIFVPHLNYVFESDYLQKLGYTKIHTIIHAGAFTPKSGAEGNNSLKSNTNISNTQALLNLSIPSLKKVIFLSTLDVYSNTKNTITENTPINPQSIYGHSKYYCEALVQNFCIKNEFDYTILRIGHVYGPGEQFYKKLIPEVMRTIIKNEKVKIWGTGEDIRSMIYIDDVVSAIIASINTTIKTPVNVASDEPVSIKEIVQTIINISGVNTIPEHIHSTHTPRNLTFDNTKLKKMLHEPKVSLEQGLRAEWEAFTAYYAKHNI